VLDLDAIFLNNSGLHTAIVKEITGLSRGAVLPLFINVERHQDSWVLVVGGLEQGWVL
jgi:hypothetical protein